MHDRIKNDYISKLVIDPLQASRVIRNGMTVAFGGQMSVGCPKAIPKALTLRKQHGEKLELDILSTSNNSYIDDLLAENMIIRKRSPMNDSRILAKQINAGEVKYCEQQMYKMPRLLRQGFYGRIDVLVVEALGITETGSIIPTTSIGIEPTLLELAQRVIVEVNTAYPMELSCLHDIIIPSDNVVKYHINEHMGSSYLSIDKEKIVGVVLNNEEEKSPKYNAPSIEQLRMVNYLIAFLEEEKRSRKWARLPPLQTGFGNIVNAINEGIMKAGWKNLLLFAGHLQESSFDLIMNGRVDAACCSSIQLSKDKLTMLQDNIQEISKCLTLRNAELINNSIYTSIIAPISLSGAIEIDIYGNVNLSHIAGSKIVNGLGGGPNFIQNSSLSIVMLPSAAKNGSISSIVPMVSHQDVCEHDVDIIITENGVADLRGKDDKERAHTIINNCSNLYKEQLNEYLYFANSRGGHHPVSLDVALSWHQRFLEYGTMKE